MKTFKPLTKAEEEIMQVLWQLEQAFIKDIVDEMPEPKPHYNTASTIIKILEDKGFAGHESFGKSNRYFPLVKKEDYSKRTMNKLVKGYFEGSFSNIVSSMVKENNLSIEELELLLKQLKKGK